MKPSNPKGTRDFSPAEMARRNHIFDACRRTFQKYGYLPIETPSLEKRETLTGKYGDEGDKLIFNVLDSGDYLSDLPDGVDKNDVKSLTGAISGKALRYDLTVPFARYVVQHQNDITFPFKRFQIQPVWRADRPQKGRYREFYQCDIDVIGSRSLMNEVELLLIINEVFTALGLGHISISINNRKVLAGVSEAYGIQDKFVDMVTALDKWDKIGKDGVGEELGKRGFDSDTVEKILTYATTNNLEELQSLVGGTQAEIGIEELNTVLESLNELNVSNVTYDPTLARGIDYYTGIIIEVKVEDFPGSLCAGGRYDDLTGLFGLKDVSGVGVSFGADRIYDVMEQANAFPDGITATTQLMITNFGAEEAAYGLKLVTRLREDGIHAELYPDAAKMKKQMAYADAKSIRYVALAGSDEIADGKITLKDMESGDQQSVTEVELYEILKRD